MLTLLFWNVNQRSRPGILASLAREHSVDVLVLAESPTSGTDIVVELQQVRSTYHMVPTLAPRIQLYTRLDSDCLTVVQEEHRLVICRIDLHQQPAILLAATHCPSKLYWSAASQSAGCEVLTRSLWEAERTLGDRRTIVLGDLNMDPFEEGVVKANGLHAVMTRALAEREQRTVQGRAYAFFYNPMWELFGQGGGKPGGTYYYDSAEYVAYFWHLYDQVLVRPALLPFLPLDGVRILVSADGHSFLTERGTPAAERASDHLPILCQLSLEARGVRHGGPSS